MNRIVLGYTGGFETALAIPRLADRFDAEIIAVALDVGQRAALVEVRERALALGARRCHVIDARETLVRHVIVPALQAGALAEQWSPAVGDLAMPVIVKTLVDVARMENACAIAHGCVDAADVARFERLARSLDPSPELIAAARIPDRTSEEKIAYARRLGIARAGHDSGDDATANVWGRSIRLAAADDDSGPAEKIFVLTRRPHDGPNQPAYLEIEFRDGVPIKANGIDMPLGEMIESVETIAGAHGVGRIDVRRSESGMSARTVSEVPAGLVLHTAHSHLQQLVVPQEVQRLIPEVGQTCASLIATGQWLSPARAPIDAFVASIQRRVTGSITLSLFKGKCDLVARTSPCALDGSARSTPASGNEQDDALNSSASEGLVGGW
jgi:argininosuccinate synthase